jgi:hypothetical protein
LTVTDHASALSVCEAMQTAFEFGYLAVILDAFSREVIGWEARL